MLRMLENFVTEEDGLEMVEWAIVAALITTAGALILTSIGTKVSAAFTQIDTALDN